MHGTTASPISLWCFCVYVSTIFLTKYMSDKKKYFHLNTFHVRLIIIAHLYLTLKQQFCPKVLFDCSRQTSKTQFHFCIPQRPFY